jgi:disulfide bond formation protein DsbB
LIAVSTGSLLTAYIAETFFDVAPCVLCIYQRVPYAIVALLGVFAIAQRNHKAVTDKVIALCAALLFVNAAIAFFHSGVELQWWEGTDGCAVNPAVFSDPEVARKMLLETPAVRCDEINFTFLGFTMANWNVVASFFWGLYALLHVMGYRVKCMGCCSCRLE